MKNKLLITSIMVLSIINLIIGIINFTNLKNLVNPEEKSLTNQSDLYHNDYFINHLWQDVSMDEIFDFDSSNYLVYFFSPGCSACKLSNEYIQAFIDYGFTNKVDIYFVNTIDNVDLLADKESDLIDKDNFKVVYTPTLLEFSNGNVTYYNGENEVFEVLDRYVKK